MGGSSVLTGIAIRVKVQDITHFCKREPVEEPWELPMEGDRVISTVLLDLVI
jgi:hypothetical protein